MKPGPEPNTLPPTTRLVPIVAVKCWKCLKIAKKIAENPESPNWKVLFRSRSKVARDTKFFITYLL